MVAALPAELAGFEVDAVVGRGSFGTVFRASRAQDGGGVVAVKWVPMGADAVVAGQVRGGPPGPPPPPAPHRPNRWGRPSATHRPWRGRWVTTLPGTARSAARPSRAWSRTCPRKSSALSRAPWPGGLATVPGRRASLLPHFGRQRARTRPRRRRSRPQSRLASTVLRVAPGPGAGPGPSVS